MSLAPGARLGPYAVTARIGAGGMGEVYRATDTSLKRDVALKVLPASVAGDATKLSRLQHEAEALAALNHPNIAQVYGLELSTGTTAIVMELVEGTTLADRLRTARSDPGRTARGLPVGEALAIARQIADALDAAHDRGIVHRDIKPSNIKIRPDGTVKVLDFGLARDVRQHVASSSATTTAFTAEGAVVGTAAYMSPEQARGDAVDKRTDIWAFGCVLYELLTGRLPFGPAGVLDRAEDAEPVAPDWTRLPSGAPPHVVQMLRRCLEPDTRQRLRDIGDAKLELQEKATPTPAAPHWPSRRRVTFGGMGLAVVAALGAWVWYREPPPDASIWRQHPAVTSSSHESNSRISPDGQWLSYLSSVGGTSTLMLKPLDGGAVQPVTLPTGTIQSHAWSSEGQRFAYSIRQGEQVLLQVVPAFFGGTPVRSVLLSSTTRAVHVLRWVNEAVFLDAQDGQTSSLMRVDLKADRPVSLDGAWSAAGTLNGMDVSPDGSTLVFSSLREGREDLWVAPLDGGPARRLTNDDFFERFPVWTGTSSHVIYQSNNGGQVDLWRIDVESGATERLTSSETIEEPESTSSDGTIVSFRHVSDDSDLWTWDPAAPTVVRMTDDTLDDWAPTAASTAPLVAFQRSLPTPQTGNPLADSTLFLGTLEQARFASAPTPIADGFAARLSPDGSRLAYLQRPPGSDPQRATLRVQPLRTGSTISISTSAPLPAYSPYPPAWARQGLAWSPAGDELYFVDRQEFFSVRRYRVGSDTAEPPLASARAREIIYDLHVSPDGRSLAYVVAAPSGCVLNIVDVPSGALRHAVPIGNSAVARGWLRDGSGVVSIRPHNVDDDYTGTLEVVVVGITGSTTAIASIASGFIATTRYDPVRSALYVTRRDNDQYNVFAVALAPGGEQTRITDNVAPETVFSGVEPLGNGAVVGVRYERKSDIWVVESVRPSDAALRPSSE